MAARQLSPLNSPAEVGLRALCLLVSGHPTSYSVERLTALDYLMVHSDDVPDGPPGLHPRTPYRGGEPLARRGVLQQGLTLLESRGLVARRYRADGLAFEVTDRSASFLDALTAPYASDLRDRSAWAIDRFRTVSDAELGQFITNHLGSWGAEFTMRSVLWEAEA